jgi:CO/xanthine dehydrogenase FAD-binding subunit
MPVLNNTVFPPTRLVSLRRAGLDAIGADGNVVNLGAAVTLATVEHDPRLDFLHDCVRAIASPAVRSLATVAGNLFVRQPYGDLAAALLALDAEAEICGTDTVRRASLEELSEAGLGAGEFVANVRLDVPGPGEFRFYKAGRRRFNSAAIVTIAARIVQDDRGVVDESRLALNAMGPRVLRCRTAERTLTGRALNVETVAAAARAAQELIDPVDDANCSAWYRRRVFPVHLRRALLGA